MPYKTITLALIEAHPALHEQLQASRTLLLTLDILASDLKAGHEAWTERFREANPGRDRRQMASEALEMAIEDLRERLASASRSDGAEPPAPGAAMVRLPGPVTPSE